MAKISKKKENMMLKEILIPVIKKLSNEEMYTDVELWKIAGVAKQRLSWLRCDWIKYYISTAVLISILDRFRKHEEISKILESKVEIKKNLTPKTDV